MKLARSAYGMSKHVGCLQSMDVTLLRRCHPSVQEFPSHLFEHFVSDPECLASYAVSGAGAAKLFVFAWAGEDPLC